MPGGSFILLTALIFSVLSGVLYLRTFNSIRNVDNQSVVHSSISTARISYYVSSALIVIASLFLFALILTNKFQYSYVASYSSRDLPFLFKISAFWAGQQGSFLFWTLMISVLGMIFIRTAEKYEPVAMAVVNGIIVFFIILMFKANPFEKLPFTPNDGSGLNPLLQNFWMAIHPPILFTGYAAATFPFALAIAAFARKSFNEWISVARKWAIFSSFTLGAGIIIGAFWAYEVLGWGGYWGWDPVENSSLVPWLLIISMIHGFILQKRKHQFIRLNYWLAIFSFILVLYATFLTRSGILADFSVHSFPDDGLAGLLMIFMLSFFLLGCAIYLRVRRHIPFHQNANLVISKEFIVFLSMFLFIGSAALIFVGTSYPLISSLFGQPAKVDTSFYNITNLPLAILAAFFLSVIPIVHWNQFKLSMGKLRMALAIFVALVMTFVANRAGITNVLHLLLVFFGVSATLLLLLELFRPGKNTIARVGAIIAHIGITLFFIGMIINADLKTSHQLILPQNEWVTLNDRLYRFEQYERAPDGKDIVKIRMIKNNNEKVITPKFYYSKYNNSYMREPFIARNIFFDTYYSPIQIRSGEPEGTHLILSKNEEKQIGELKVKFVKFQMGQHGSGDAVKVGTELKVTRGTYEYTVVPAIVFANGRRESVSDYFTYQDESEEKVIFALEQIDANSKQIKLRIQTAGTNSPTRNMLVMEVKKEPIIGFVWLGFFLIILGNVLPIAKTERS